MERENQTGIFGRLRGGLRAMRERVFAPLLTPREAGGKDLPPSDAQALEHILLAADFGSEGAKRVLAALRSATTESASPREALRAELLSMLAAPEPPRAEMNGGGLRVVFVAGVNGSGKTTTVGKLAHRLRSEGKRVLLCAADTFRAAAAEQLEIWGGRSGCPVVKHKEGASPAAVVFDAIHRARAEKMDVLLADTAGRLHTKTPLMEELKKMARVAGRECPGAPHEVLLVLDAGTGQNALAQAREFHEALGVTGLVLTKLDGTAKGGAIFRIVQDMKIPVRYVGVGEGMDDLEAFSAEAFVEALLSGGDEGVDKYS